MSINKHRVWEASRDVSMVMSGISSRLEAAKAGITEQAAWSEEDRAEAAVFTADLEERIGAVQVEVAGSIDQIFLLEGLSDEIGLWREADLLKFIAAAQRYDRRELIISAVLCKPNLEMLFEEVEPDNAE